jgi:hypothetical protein
MKVNFKHKNASSHLAVWFLVGNGTGEMRKVDVPGSM